MTNSTAKPVQSQARLKALEEEGNFAADYLEPLLDILEMDGDLEMCVENDRAVVSVVASVDNDSKEDAIVARRLRKLVGNDGEVLDALQELTRLAVQSQSGDRSRCMVDIAGHREGIRREYEKIAQDAVAKCESTGKSIPLDPMGAFERKVVHDVVTAAGLVSASDGEEPYRYITVHPKK